MVTFFGTKDCSEKFTTRFDSKKLQILQWI